MEVKEKSKKRELIKSIAIVFLAVLLVLTLFSNTIMNASLPEVATQRITSGTINARIRGSGTVTATESYEVTIPQTREVRSILVRVGDEVQQGDVLFILADGDSSELQAAQEELRQLNDQYQRQLLQLAQGYNGEDREIRALREEIADLTRQRDENAVTDDQMATVEADLAAEEENLVWTNFNIGQINTYKESAEKELSAAQSELSYWESRVNSLEGQGSGGDDVAAAKRVLESYWLAYEDLYREFLLEVREYYEGTELNETARIFGEDDRAKGKYYIFKLSPAEKTGEDGTVTPVPEKDRFSNIEDSNGLFTITSEQQKYIDAYLYARDSVGGTQPEPENPGDQETPEEPENPENAENPENIENTAGASVSGQLAAGNGARAAGTISGESVYTTLLNAYSTWRSANSSTGGTNSLAYAMTQRNSAQSAVDSAQHNVDFYQNQITDLESQKTGQETAIEELKQALEDLKTKRAASEQAAEDIKDREQALADKLVDQDISHQINDMDLADARRQIQRKEEEIDKLRGDVIDTEIKANVSGTVTAINASAGKEAAAGDTLATIDLTDRGYTVRVSVTSEQARQVKVGDTADVANYYWGRSMTAVLEQILADPDSRGQRRILVFRVTGDVDPGTNITLSIGQRSSTYETIVPKSALREDSNGHFVLVVTSRNTPLGNRYTATRVDVEVLAEDDTSAAVSGLTANDYVITTSSAPLSAGSQIRLAEDRS